MKLAILMYLLGTIDNIINFFRITGVILLVILSISIIFILIVEYDRYNSLSIIYQEYDTFWDYFYEEVYKKLFLFWVKLGFVLLLAGVLLPNSNTIALMAAIPLLQKGVTTTIQNIQIQKILDISNLYLDKVIKDLQPSVESNMP